MKDTVRIKDLRQVKVFAHPLRARLVEVFADKPRTAKQAAEIMGQKPTKLYHHVEALERVGLIKLVKTGKKRGTIEKYYRTVAKRFSIDSRLFEMTKNGKKVIGEFRAMLNTMLENTMHEINESISQKLICPEKKETEVAVVRKHIRTNPAKLKQLQERIQEMIEGLADVDEESGEIEYRFVLVFYPLVKKKRRR
ncbi:MAG: helix-turn-helix domain-containing protein [candidate division WOR-3 bacterium]|nr:MAG: helix-turn-helix domain-containing protein [candidate division WOR-3 bacterium]